MSKDLQDCFRILEIEPNSSLEDVKRSYRVLVKVWHPDLFTRDPKFQARAQEKLKLINVAYERVCTHFIERYQNVPTFVAAKPTTWVNSLGMIFVPVPGTKVLFSIWQTRVQDYQALGSFRQKPKFEQGPTHPAVCISWDESRFFCNRLTAKEQQMGKLTGYQAYRLPTDKEWSCAVGLPDLGAAFDLFSSFYDKAKKFEGVYPWGTQWPPPKGAGNYGVLKEVRKKGWFFDDEEIVYDSGYKYTAPVGSFNANKYGLFDLGGNVREWCEDDSHPEIYRSFCNVLRGGSWRGGFSHALWSAWREGEKCFHYSDDIGFRCVLDLERSYPY